MHAYEVYTDAPSRLSRGSESLALRTPCRTPLSTATERKSSHLDPMQLGHIWLARPRDKSRRYPAATAAQVKANRPERGKLVAGSNIKINGVRDVVTRKGERGPREDLETMEGVGERPVICHVFNSVE